jgi:hypothetical protein
MGTRKGVSILAIWLKQHISPQPIEPSASPKKYDRPRRGDGAKTSTRRAAKIAAKVTTMRLHRLIERL